MLEKLLCSCIFCSTHNFRIKSKFTVFYLFIQFFRRIKDKIIKPILKPILKPICSVLNYGGIRRAKNARGAAQGAVNGAREQLANRQRELENHRSSQVNIRNRHVAANAQLQALRNSLSQLQSRQAPLANMTTEMRKVTQHIMSFLSKSTAIYEEMQKLVTFDTVVIPLNIVLTELIDNGVTTKEIFGAIQTSAVEVGWVTDSINLIKSRLPTLPMNDGDSFTC